jgi:hypothetical protein
MKAPIAQFGALPGDAQNCAIGAIIGFYGQNLFKITRMWADLI